MLVEHAGEIVTREEFHRLLWGGDTFGEFDHNLNNAINKLRRALNDCATTPRYIETLPRVGYRFVAPVQRQAPSSEAPAGNKPVAIPASAPAPLPHAATFKLVGQAAMLAIVCLTIGAMVAVGYNRWPGRKVLAAVAADTSLRTQKSDPNAYEYYLKGRYYWNKRNKPQVLQAIKYFQEAISKDSNYALAYSGLADSYSVLGMTARNPKDLYQKAREAALESVKLDEKSAEAHTSLALVYFCGWNFAEATGEFQKAFSLNPRYATAHHWYGLQLRDTGRATEGLKELELAHRLDPLSVQISFAVANAYRKDGHYAEAERRYAEIVRFDSEFQRVNAGLALLYAIQPSLQEVLAGNVWHASSQENDPQVSEYVAVGLYQAGRKQEALRLMAQLTRQIKPSEGCFPFLLAAMGERDRSINCLEKGYQEGAGYMPEIKTDPLLRDLRSDPRFQDLLDRVGLPSGRPAANP